jgi:HemY protein
MVRLILFLLLVAAIAAGLHWLADRPGRLFIEWQDSIVETSVFHAIVLATFGVGLAIFLWSIVRQIWKSPSTVGQVINRRRERRGLEALSHGMIAIGSGDHNQAARAAVQARKSLPNEPLTQLLRAQTAQITGDRATSRRIFEAMLGSPDTELLGLRGLYLEAQRENETEAARQFAERALQRNAKLDWPVEALFDMQCKSYDWSSALDTLAIGRRNGQIDKRIAERRRAVLLTAQAQQMEDGDPAKVEAMSLEAHGLAPDLVPAAAIAGRVLAARGNTPKATKVLQKTWRLAPHPDLATIYAYARPGDSILDRLERTRQLARLVPGHPEGAIALATAAIEAQQFDEARTALAPLLDGGRLTQRVATLMARLESAEHGNTGRVREWLARAVNAQRDPAWTADGKVSDRWAAVSPVTGRLDAFEWKVPVDDVEALDGDVLTRRIEALVPLGAAPRLTGRLGEEDDDADPSSMTTVIASRADARGQIDDLDEVPITTPVREQAYVTVASTRDARAGAHGIGLNGAASSPPQPPSEPVSLIAARAAEAAHQAALDAARAAAAKQTAEAGDSAPEMRRVAS